MTNKEIRKSLEKSIRALGYATNLNGLGRAGRHQTVCCFWNGIRADGKRVVFTVGVDHELPQEERDALWLEHGNKIADGLADAGVNVDFVSYGTRRDGRAFAVNL